MAIVNTVKMVKVRRKKLYPAFLFPFSIFNGDITVGYCKTIPELQFDSILIKIDAYEEMCK